VTSLSEYLRAERADPSEPVTFYAPGAWGWDDPNVRARRSKVAGGGYAQTGRRDPETGILLAEEVIEYPGSWAD
jgi:hypothetical protein